MSKMTLFSSLCFLGSTSGCVPREYNSAGTNAQDGALQARRQRTPAPTGAPIDNQVASPNFKELVPISQETLKHFFATVRNVRFVGEDNRPYYIPWGSVSENCNRRASASSYVLAQVAKNPKASDESFNLDPSKLSSFAEWAATEKPVSGRILVTGPIHLAYRTVLWNKDFTAPERVSSRDGDNLSGWDHHVATVINLEGKAMVLDLATFPSKAVSVNEWVAALVHKDVKCPEVTKDIFKSRNSYWMMRWQFNSEFPKPGEECGYTFDKQFGLSDGGEGTPKSLIADELRGMLSLLGGNFQGMAGELGGLQDPAALRNSGIQIVRKIEDGRGFGEEGFCKAMGGGLKFCKKYGK